MFNKLIEKSSAKLFGGYLTHISLNGISWSSFATHNNCELLMHRYSSKSRRYYVNHSIAIKSTHTYGNSGQSIEERNLPIRNLSVYMSNMSVRQKLSYIVSLPQRSPHSFYWGHLIISKRASGKSF